jgi:hypothetical protein
MEPYNLCGLACIGASSEDVFGLHKKRDHVKFLEAIKRMFNQDGKVTARECGEMAE